MNEKELTSSFKALSCETRRKIIYLLKSKCLCAGDIAKHFELTGATISHHLKVLTEGNLITSKKVGLEIYYSLNIEKYNVLIRWFQFLNDTQNCQRERDKMNTPKYLEIAELIRIDIFVKYVKANQLIPSIRRYAQIYNVNPNTVSRAFRLLEADDIIYSYRTRGYYVSENIQKKKEEYGRKYAKHLLNVLQRLGYSDMEIEKMVEEVIKR